MTREELLNNPGGIEHEPGVTWGGQSQDQPDHTFVKFTGPGWGIRAIVKTLHTYQTKHGVKTMRQAISRWAPPSVLKDGKAVFENNTEAYIDDVCQRCGVGEDDEIDFQVLMPTLVKAIIRHENGDVIYDDATIAQAIAMAGVP